MDGLLKKSPQLMQNMSTSQASDRVLTTGVEHMDLTVPSQDQAAGGIIRTQLQDTPPCPQKDDIVLEAVVKDLIDINSPLVPPT